MATIKVDDAAPEASQDELQPDGRATRRELLTKIGLASGAAVVTTLLARDARAWGSWTGGSGGGKKTLRRRRNYFSRGRKKKKKR